MSEPTTNKQRTDALYKLVRESDINAYQRICAFAYVFGQRDEKIDIATRVQVERFCMSIFMHGKASHD